MNAELWRNPRKKTDSQTPIPDPPNQYFSAEKIL